MSKKTVIGVDVGGTKIRAGRVSPQGKLLASIKIPTDVKKGKAAVLANIAKSVAEVWTDDVKAIGVGLAGVVDHEKGIYRQGPNFPPTFRDVPVAAILKRKYGVRTVIDNDVHCFTLAEAKVGAAKGAKHVVGLTLGTGIGGGIVIDGKLYRGRNNAAGELGHMTIALDSENRCGCGKDGHFEAFASGTAMSNLYLRGTGRMFDALTIEKAALAGEPQAIETLATMANGLSVGLANIIHALNPDMIVIGGGLSAVVPLWKPVMKKVRDLVIFPELRDTPIVRSTLGGDANILGAALLAET